MIEYVTDVSELDVVGLDGFFEGWRLRPSPEQHLLALRGSEHVVVAREAGTGRIVGFVTAVGDGVLSAYIPLLEVRPEYRGLGIGTELVRRVLELLGGRYMIDLCCDEALVPFYERFGMQRWVAMGLRNREALRRGAPTGT